MRLVPINALHFLDHTHGITSIQPSTVCGRLGPWAEVWYQISSKAHIYTGLVCEYVWKPRAMDN